MPIYTFGRSGGEAVAKHSVTAVMDEGGSLFVWKWGILRVPKTDIVKALGLGRGQSCDTVTSVPPPPV